VASGDRTHRRVSNELVGGRTRKPGRNMGETPAGSRVPRMGLAFRGDRPMRRPIPLIEEPTLIAGWLLGTTTQ
jgi:hypothetical protein